MFLHISHEILLINSHTSHTALELQISYLDWKITSTWWIDCVVIAIGLVGVYGFYSNTVIPVKIKSKNDDIIAIIADGFIVKISQFSFSVLHSIKTP